MPTQSAHPDVLPGESKAKAEVKVEASLAATFSNQPKTCASSACNLTNLYLCVLLSGPVSVCVCVPLPFNLLP